MLNGFVWGDVSEKHIHTHTHTRTIGVSWVLSAVIQCVNANVLIADLMLFHLFERFRSDILCECVHGTCRRLYKIREREPVDPCRSYAVLYEWTTVMCLESGKLASNWYSLYHRCKLPHWRVNGLRRTVCYTVLLVGLRLATEMYRLKLNAVQRSSNWYVWSWNTFFSQGIRYVFHFRNDRMWMAYKCYWIESENYF